MLMTTSYAISIDAMPPSAASVVEADPTGKQQRAVGRQNALDLQTAGVARQLGRAAVAEQDFRAAIAHYAAAQHETAGGKIEAAELAIARPKAGRRRPPPVGIKQSGKATFA